MKKMLTYIFRMMAVAVVLMAAASCQEFHIDSQPEAPLSLNVDAQDTYDLLAVSPAKVVFNISSNTPWTISSDSQWCVPTPAMSASSSLVSEIVVTTEDNQSKTSRTAVLTIEAEGVAEPKVITIRQASRQNLVVVPFDERVATEGQTVTFTVVSNKPWEVIPSTAFVSDIDRKSGPGSEDGAEEVISVSVPANPGAVRSGEITVRTDYDSYTFEIVQNGIVIQLEDDPEAETIALDGNGLAVEKVIPIRSNKEWKVEVPSEYSSWLSAENIDGSNLRIVAATNTRLCTRSAVIVLKTKELIEGFEGVNFEVTQPGCVNFSEGTVYVEDEATGNVRVEFSKGEMFRTSFLTKKGRTVIELEKMQMSAIYNLGFNFTSSSNANYKLHLEGSNTWWFRCAGGFSWVAPIKKPYTFDDVNALRKLEFVVEDDPAAAGKLSISIYLNGTLYGTQTGRTDVFAAGDPGCPFIFEAGAAPAEGDHCVFKSITYIPAE